jgi:hypothetical protein
MATMTMSEKLSYCKEPKTFFGQASFVKILSKDGADPYKIIWNM